MFVVRCQLQRTTDNGPLTTNHILNMETGHKTSRSLSEIGHLFLSSVRERQTNGAPMPRRQGPQRVALSVPAAPLMDMAIDVGAEEIAPAGPRLQAELPALGAEERLGVPPVSLVLGTHLGRAQFDRAKEYARHLAAQGKRVGLIEVEGSEFRLSRFEATSADFEFEGADAAARHVDKSVEARSLADALEEMSWDLDRWLLVLPHLRSPEARALLADVNDWVLLSTCDHEGVVSCYRTLKGVSELPRPRLSLALFDAAGTREAEQVHQKLASVCRQFLDWPLAFEGAVGRAADVAMHVVMQSGAGSEMGQPESSPQWKVLAGFVARAKAQPPKVEAISGASEVETPAATRQECNALGGDDETEASEAMTRNKMSMPVEPSVARVMPPEAQSAQPALRWAGTDAPEAMSEVIELPEAASASASILAAILRNESNELVECRVTPPMCPDAKLAVTRDHRIVLLAAARQGLGEMRSIGRAYNWLIENYSLICMAMPQMAIDPSAQPCLRLLIDHADLSAEILQPMLQSSTVSVQAYRRLRWGAKTGLLLEAA